jgi:hypothetical protein
MVVPVLMKSCQLAEWKMGPLTTHAATTPVAIRKAGAGKARHRGGQALGARAGRLGTTVAALSAPLSPGGRRVGRPRTFLPGGGRRLEPYSAEPK